MTQIVAPDNNLSLLPCRFEGKPARRFRRKLDTGRSITTGLLLPDEAGVLFLRKELDASHHVMSDDAIAIDEGTLDAAQAAGAVYVLAVDADTGETWRQDIATLRRIGWTENRSAAGWQLYARKAHWNKTADELAKHLVRQAVLLWE